MSSNMMSFTEPVPSGTWQSSVLISVKLLMFQGDVLFFGKDLFLSMWHLSYMWAFWSQVASPTKFCSPLHAETWHSWTSWRPCYVFLHCLGPSGITTDLEAAFPTDEKRSCVWFPRSSALILFSMFCTCMYIVLNISVRNNICTLFCADLFNF